MAKTRSQSAAPLLVKKEEEESKTELKHHQLLNGISTATKPKGKITKKTSVKINNSNPLSVSRIKLEKKLDNCQNRQLPKQKIPKPARIFKDYGVAFCTAELINAFIKYIVKDKMTIKEASRKVNICTKTGYLYYNKYIEYNKIPEPLKKKTSFKFESQDQLKQYLDYIVKDNMSVKAAARKLNISISIGRRYYEKYLKYPNKPLDQLIKPGSNMSSQKQVKDLIGYLVKDKMSITKASEKVNMHRKTGRKYYNIYKNDPKHRIPVPGIVGQRRGRNSTPEQLKGLVENVVENKMSVHAAAIKLKLGFNIAYRHYNEYLKNRI